MASTTSEDPRRKQRPFWQRAVPVVFGFPYVAVRLGWQTALVIVGMGSVGSVMLKYAPFAAWKPKEGDVFPVRETPLTMVAFIILWMSLTMGLAMYLRSRFGW